MDNSKRLCAVGEYKTTAFNLAGDAYRVQNKTVTDSLERQAFYLLTNQKK